LAIFISPINVALLDQLKQSGVDDEKFQDIMSKLSNEEVVPKYSSFQGLLYRGGRLVVGRNVELQTQIIQLFHDSALGDHAGVAVTTKKGGLLILVEGSW